MNWYKKAQIIKEKKVKVINPNFLIYKKYKKIIIEIPDLPIEFFRYIQNDIRDSINSKINDYGEKWYLKLMAFNKKKYGNGNISWLMFNKLKDEKDKYWIDPNFISVLTQALDKIKYDYTELIPFSQIKDRPEIKVTGQVSDDKVQIQFLGFVPPIIQEQIKKLKFWGKKVGNTFIWTKNTKKIDEQIYAISYLENIELNINELIKNTISYFKNKINNLPMTELIVLDSGIIRDGSFGDKIIRPIIEESLSKYINIETGEIINNSEPKEKY